MIGKNQTVAALHDDRFDSLPLDDGAAIPGPTHVRYTWTDAERERVLNRVNNLRADLRTDIVAVVEMANKPEWLVAGEGIPEPKPYSRPDLLQARFVVGTEEIHLEVGISGHQDTILVPLVSVRNLIEESDTAILPTSEECDRIAGAVTDKLVDAMRYDLDTFRRVTRAYVDRLSVEELMTEARDNLSNTDLEDLNLTSANLKNLGLEPRSGAATNPRRRRSGPR